MKTTPQNSIPLSAMGVAAIVTITLAAQAAFAAPANQADTFVDSIGVCTHMWHTNTPYTTNFSGVKAKLLAANIRHIRDDLAVDRPAGVAAWKDLAASGIKTGYIFNQQWATVDSFKNFLISSDLLPTADYFEGPNEFDGSRTDWMPVLKSYQMELYTKMKADPRTASHPVLAPSFIINQPERRTELGNISAWADFGNCHPYPGGHMPSTSQTLNEISYCSINTGTKPVFVTEIGYHNAVNTTDGHHPTSETAAAIYLPRVYFDTYSRGIARTYYYQFVDHFTDGGVKKDIEAYFGLLRFDLTEKPAYTALMNLTAIMKDPGASFTPGGLGFSLSGAPVKSVLFQKRDGTFYLALWREVSVWNPGTRTDLVPDAADVTVALPGLFNIESYSPTQSASAQQTWTGVTNATVSLRGEVKILKIHSNFRLISHTTGTPMHLRDRNVKVQYGEIGADAWSSHWNLIKNSDGYYTIRSRWTNDFIHIENLLGHAQYAPNFAAKWSAQWDLVKNGNYYMLKNRWAGAKLHNENNYGYVQYGAMWPDARSTYWTLTAAP